VIRTVLTTAAIAMLALGALGCTEQGDCEKTVDHIMELIQRDVTDGKPIDVAKEREQLIAECKADDSPLTKKQEECVLAVTSLPELSRCDRR